MRLGVVVQSEGRTLADVVAQVRAAAGAGFASAYLTQRTSWDGIGLAGAAAREVPGVEVGVAVTQTFPRHPLALAGQALTAQAVGEGRFVLGVGPGHSGEIEGRFGLPFERPARHVREYLTVLMPLLRGEAVDFHGETLTAVGRAEVPGVTPPPVLVSALGPAMLRVAGELADGTVTVWSGAELMGEYVVPSLTRAAAAAGRPDPRVLAITLVSVTADPDRVKARIAEELGAAGNLPSYRAVLDRQGLTGPQDTVVAGDEAAVERALRSFADAGTTELVVSPAGDEAEQARTLEFLASLGGRV
ncbi:MAG TPA: TIGR03564 family F420-dependent LLM class oxidoreductase [Thermomonospora sp.]|nr:TIGR03564 family F420-dependent LLM class oxidoreductase [Thermomonospora sp.]